MSFALSPTKISQLLMTTGLICVVGGIWLFLGNWQIWRTERAFLASAKKVTATVIDSRDYYPLAQILPRQSLRYRIYQLILSYQLDGHTYTTDWVPTTGNFYEAAQLTRTIDVLYDPARPSHVKVDDDVQPAQAIVRMVAGGLIGFIGIGLIGAAIWRILHPTP